MSKDIEKLTIKELLESNEYRIPIYQRNYAWGIGETTQLIQDVADYAKDSPDSSYYIGNLIVFPRVEGNHTYYETIDGQQRTTTLTILICAIRYYYKNTDLSWYQKVNIFFDHREKSNSTLNAIFNHPFSRIDDNDVNTDIITVFNKAWSIIDIICKEKKLDNGEFISYFLTRVRILRICVPKETSLNHYFEIMNSRSEQLEQHEIVKAWLMSPMKDDKEAMAAFNMIWESCANMDRYIQMNFNKDFRIFIFDNNGTSNLIKGFNDIVDFIKNNKGKVLIDKEEKSLFALFKDYKQNTPYKKPWENNSDKEYPETYHSIITFSNFLLHVLKIMKPRDEKVVLDDKRLIQIFKYVLDKYDNKMEFAEDFIVNLLDIRYLFDKYIIKRKQDKWSLKQLFPQKSQTDRYYYKDTFSKDESENESESVENHKIIMLLSMFHVSAPSQIYKNWMNAALYYIYNNRSATPNEYANYLWSLAKAYMLDKYLANAEHTLPFETIIYRCNGKPRNTKAEIYWSNINIGEYPQVGENIDNFVFNFYDYLLWQENQDADFEFSYRTSVEHFYPQHPTDKGPMDFDHLHSFGNLCLINRGINSKFTNNLPEAKNANFGGIEEMKVYSLKLKDMMNCIKNHDKWDETKISSKEQEAKERIEKALS